MCHTKGDPGVTMHTYRILVGYLEASRLSKGWSARTCNQTRLRRGPPDVKRKGNPRATLDLSELLAGKIKKTGCRPSAVGNVNKGICENVELELTSRQRILEKYLASLTMRKDLVT